MENRSLTKTRAEVAEEFGISPRTLRRWLSDLQITLPQRKYLLPEEYEVLYQAIREMGKIDRRLN